jgi:hypothetical protein
MEKGGLELFQFNLIQLLLIGIPIKNRKPVCELLKDIAN